MKKIIQNGDKFLLFDDSHELNILCGTFTTEGLREKLYKTERGLFFLKREVLDGETVSSEEILPLIILADDGPVPDMQRIAQWGIDHEISTDEFLTLILNKIENA